jgi:hypothetical protein
MREPKTGRQGKREQQTLHDSNSPFDTRDFPERTASLEEQQTIVNALYDRNIRLTLVSSESPPQRNEADLEALRLICLGPVVVVVPTSHVIALP